VRLRNRVTEKDLRVWLDHEGWFGRSAKIDSLELYAIKRPGWEQVFRFEIEAKKKPLEAESLSPGDQPLPPETGEHDQMVRRWGAIHDDERTKANRPSIWIYEKENELLSKLEKLSEEMIVLRQGQTSAALLPLMAVVVLVILFASFAKFFFQ
jgi:hypothetical protein